MNYHIFIESALNAVTGNIIRQIAIDEKIRHNPQSLAAIMSSINLLDAGFAIVLILFFARGILRGMVNEIAGLVGLFLAFFVAGRYYPQALPHVSKFVTDPDWASVAAYAAVFLAVMVSVALIAVAVRKFMSLTFTAWLDHLGGAVVGAAKGLLICGLATALLERFASGSPFLKGSLLVPYMQQITAFVRSLLPSTF